MSKRTSIVVRGLCWLLGAVLVVVAWSSNRDRPPEAQPGASGRGRLERINGYLVLHVEGSPEEMGRQHGRLLKPQIQRACRALITDSYAGDGYDRLIAGAKVMEKFQPEEFRRELKALAEAAEIDYWDCVAMQLFGDVDRGAPADATDVMQCTSYAAFGPATKTGELIAGRNLDYWDSGVGEYAAILMHVKPDRGHAFLTVTWAGIINGWTLMNEKGLVTANNTSGGDCALEGISTCFLLRKVAQYASTVDEGIAIVEKEPRACGTNMLIAGGSQPDAAMVEFDHGAVAVRRAERGYVLAANSFRVLHERRLSDSIPFTSSRYAALEKLIREHHGSIDRTMNFAGAEGVPLSFNLHSDLLFPKDLIIRVSMGKTPAYKYPYVGFRMTPDGVVAE